MIAINGDNKVPNDTPEKVKLVAPDGCSGTSVGGRWIPAVERICEVPYEMVLHLIQHHGFKRPEDVAVLTAAPASTLSAKVKA